MMSRNKTELDFIQYIGEEEKMCQVGAQELKYMTVLRDSSALLSLWLSSAPELHLEEAAEVESLRDFKAVGSLFTA